MHLTGSSPGSPRRTATPVIFVIVLSAWLAACGGCSYLKDRGRDAADVFTCSAGIGAGATVRVGPAHLGLFLGRDVVGLRGGQWIVDRRDDSFPQSPGYTTDMLLGLPGGWAFGEDALRGNGSGKDDTEMLTLRGKCYIAKGPCPFIYCPEDYSYDKYPAYFFTQVEVAVGVGVFVRVGFNPGELVDFVLGCVGIDIYGDDVAAKIRKIPAGTPPPDDEFTPATRPSEEPDADVVELKKLLGL